MLQAPLLMFEKLFAFPFVIHRVKCGSDSLLGTQILQSYKETPENHFGADEDFQSNSLKSLYHQK